MENDKELKNPQKVLKIIGACISVLLIVFEIIILVQYVGVDERPAAWTIFLLVAVSVILDILCLIDLYIIKKLAARIVVYCIDFVILLLICAFTASIYTSIYLSALYCVILSLFYLNVEEWRTKLIVFGVSCFMFIITLILGWFFHYIHSVTAAEILTIVSDSIMGLIILIIHFAVANFLIVFYRLNIRLKSALKEADESKARLEEAYDQLSETAVFEERNRIARDIHDNAGHSMTSVIMQTEAAKLLIDTDPEGAKAKIVSANIQAKNALEQMRESVHLLAGREEATTIKQELESVIAQTMDGTEVKIRYDLEDVHLSGSRRRFMINSLKELLSNGMRHGGATAFFVGLATADGTIELTVSDNGSGLPEEFKEGFGLKGIREKATEFGGYIIYESESGDGCEIKIGIAAEENGDKDND